MKRFFTLAALFISMVSFAAAPPRAGRLIISNADNSISHVRINGRIYNVDQQTIILSNLVGGRHILEVYRTERNPYNFGRAKSVMVYSTPVYVDPSFIVDVTINRFGRVSIAKSMKMRNGDFRNYDARDDRYDYDKRNGGYDDNRNGGYDGNRGGGYDDGRNGGYNDKNGGYNDGRNAGGNMGKPGNVGSGDDRNANGRGNDGQVGNKNGTGNGNRPGRQ